MLHLRGASKGNSVRFGPEGQHRSRFSAGGLRLFSVEVPLVVPGWGNPFSRFTLVFESLPDRFLFVGSTTNQDGA